MTQEECWLLRYNEVVSFIETNLLCFSIAGRRDGLLYGCAAHTNSLHFALNLC